MVCARSRMARPARSGHSSVMKAAKPGVAVSSTTAAPVGMANPASVNCGKIGDTVEIKKNPDGSEYGMCTFQNGTSCEEWALFRNEGCKAK